VSQVADRPHHITEQVTFTDGRFVVGVPRPTGGPDVVSIVVSTLGVLRCPSMALLSLQVTVRLRW
jgi:hypothetical protein